MANLQLRHFHQLRRVRWVQQLGDFRLVSVFVVLIFVLFPFLVYNSVRLDRQLPLVRSNDAFYGQQYSPSEVKRVTPWLDANQFKPLAKCLNVSTASLMDGNQLKELQHSCLERDTTTRAGPRVPRVVHFVYVPLTALDGRAMEDIEREDFTFLQYASVQACKRVLQPDIMVLHYVGKEPRGHWFTQCRRFLSFHQSLLPQLPRDLDVSPSKKRQLAEFLLMLKVLRMQGGGLAFAGFSVLPVHHFESLRMFDVVLSQSREQVDEPPGDATNPEQKTQKDLTPLAAFGIDVKTILAHGEAPLLKHLESKLLKDLRTTREIGKMPLEQLVAQLVVRFATTAATDANAKPNLIVGSSKLFAFPSERELASDFFDAKQINLRQVFAVQLDGEELLGSRNLLPKVSTQIVDVQSLMEAPSGFGALLRFHVGVNNSAEIIPFVQ